MTALSIGVKIGQGMSAEVYDMGGGKVLKLYREWMSREAIRHEERIGKAVQASGAPCPAILGEVEHEGRLGLVFERIPGCSMLIGLERRPLSAARFGRELARLHHDIHARRTADLPDQRQHFLRSIQQSSPQLGDRTDRVLAALDRLPAGHAVCHGDFHPDNVIIDGARIVPIDWSNAFSGNPAADVVRTGLMLRSPYMPPEVPVWMHRIAGWLKRRMLDAYMAEYRRLSGLSRAELELFVLPVAAARLHENIPGEREWLLDLVDGALTRDEAA